MLRALKDMFSSDRDLTVDFPADVQVEYTQTPAVVEARSLSNSKRNDGVEIIHCTKAGRLLLIGYPVKSATKHLTAYLKKHYAHRYLIWNLSRKSYDYSLFENQVFEFWKPPDCHSPLEMIFRICHSIESWVNADDDNVAVVHGNPGSDGRVEMAIACIMTYLHVFDNAFEAFDWICHRRGIPSDFPGRPSIRRYVGYFSDMFTMEWTKPPNPGPVKLVSIIINAFPEYEEGGINTLEIRKGDTRLFQEDFVPSFGFVYVQLETVLSGDVILICRRTFPDNTQMLVFMYKFHTGFVPSAPYPVPRNSLDGPFVDMLEETFFIDLIMTEPNEIDHSNYLNFQLEETEGVCWKLMKRRHRVASDSVAGKLHRGSSINNTENFDGETTSINGVDRTSCENDPHLLLDRYHDGMCDDCHNFVMQVMKCEQCAQDRRAISSVDTVMVGTGYSRAYSLALENAEKLDSERTELSDAIDNNIFDGQTFPLMPSLAHTISGDILDSYDFNPSGMPKDRCIGDRKLPLATSVVSIVETLPPCVYRCHGCDVLAHSMRIEEEDSDSTDHVVVTHVRKLFQILPDQSELVKRLILAKQRAIQCQAVLELSRSQSQSLAESLSTMTDSVEVADAGRSLEDLMQELKEKGEVNVKLGKREKERLRKDATRIQTKSMMMLKEHQEKMKAWLASGKVGPPPPPPLPPPPPPASILMRSDAGEDAPKRTRQLQWEVIPEMCISDDTVWGRLDGGASDDLADLQADMARMFAATNVVVASGKGLRNNKIEVVQDSKRATRLGIILSKFAAKGISYSEIRSALLNVDDGKLSLDNLEGLRKCTPYADELRRLKEAQTAKQKPSTEAERFFLEASMDVPRLELRVGAMITRRTFDTDVRSLSACITNLKLCLEELHNSERIPELLEVVLALGNLLNRRKAAGFKISSLLKLVDTRSVSGGANFTLLHYLASILDTRKPHLLDFYEDIPHLCTACKLPLEQIRSDFNRVSAGVLAAHEEAQRCAQANYTGPSGDLFGTVMIGFCETATAVTDILEDELEDLESYAKIVVEYFGEDRDCVSLLNDLLSFICVFKKVVKENELQRDLVRRAADKFRANSGISAQGAANAASLLNVRTSDVPIGWMTKPEMASAAASAASKKSEKVSGSIAAASKTISDDRNNTFSLGLGACRLSKAEEFDDAVESPRRE